MFQRILLLWLLGTVSALAQTGAVQGHSFVGGTPSVTSGLKSANYLDGIIPHATITVYFTGTTNLVPGSQIFSNSTGTVLGNPFTSNDISSLNPGGWLFFAAQGQGYDVVGSGGLSPNTYGAPTPLCTDCFASGGGGGGGSGCSTGGIPTTNGSVTGDNSSTNCGYENRVGDTAAVPANVSTFGYLNSANNSATDLVVAGDTNGAYTSGHDGVLIGNQNAIGSTTAACPFDDAVLIGYNNMPVCPARNSSSVGSVVAIGDMNLYGFPSTNTMELEGVVAIGEANLPDSVSASSSFGAMVLIGYNNGDALTGVSGGGGNGYDLIGIGDTTLEGTFLTGSGLVDVVAIGDGSGDGIPDGSYDAIAIGDGSGDGGTGGTQQEFVSIGVNAVDGATGHDVIGIGDEPLTGINRVISSSGHDLIGIGNTSLACNTTGSDNIGIGDYAGAIGYTGTVCGNSNETGSHNVWIGDTAGPNTATQLSNTIAIGYQAYNTASNQVVLGNSSVTSLILYGCSAGQVAYDDGTGTCVSPVGSVSPLTTKGDIWVYSSTDTRLPVGTNGQILSANSAQTTGLQWINALSNPMTSVGDVITGGASGVASRVAANTTTNSLCLVETGTGSAGQAPTWSACSGSNATALSSVSAASTNATIANANNPIVWNWAQTSNSQAAFTFGETSAATGTSDQEVVVSTATGSTAVPLTVTDSLNSAQTIPAVQILPTWNTTGVVDAALLVNVTNTASGAASKLFDLQVGGTSKMAVDKTGSITNATWNGVAIANASLATQTANTVLGALTATTPSGLAMPSCSTSNHALQWTSGTGFSCASISGGVSSFTGDGTFITNSGSTGAVTATIAYIPAASGANSDITSLAGLTTALSVPQGGTGAATNTGYLIGHGTSATTSSATIPGSVISSDITHNAANLSAAALLPTGTTAATPSVNDNSAKLATTAYVNSPGNISPTSVTVTGSGPSTLGLTGTTYSALTTAFPCASNAGKMAFVTDSTTQVWGAAYTGGGSLPAFVGCDGSAYGVIGK